MFDYYFRILKTDYDAFLTFCEERGLIKRDDKDAVYVVGNGVWDYIGEVVDETTGTEDVKLDGERVKIGIKPIEKDGVAYVHVNLRTEFDIEKFITREEIAKFCYTDIEGNLVKPEFPVRVFL